MKFICTLILALTATITLGNKGIEPTHYYEKTTKEITVVKETDYIKDYKYEFVDKMWSELNKHTDLSDSTITTLVSQSALESNWGRCSLSKKHNNYFGITGVNPKGGSVNLPTREYIDGKWITMWRRFRTYTSLKQNIEDRVRILKVVNNYATAPSYWLDVKGIRKKIKSSLAKDTITITNKYEINRLGGDRLPATDSIYSELLYKRNYTNNNVHNNFNDININIDYGETITSKQERHSIKRPRDSRRSIRIRSFIQEQRDWWSKYINNLWG